MADINKTMDTVECFFLLATENSTSMSKKCIDDVLSIISWVKGRHRRIDTLERDLMEGVSLVNASRSIGDCQEADVRLAHWADKARLWKAEAADREEQDRVRLDSLELAIEILQDQTRSLKLHWTRFADDLPAPGRAFLVYDTDVEKVTMVRETYEDDVEATLYYREMIPHFLWAYAPKPINPCPHGVVEILSGGDRDCQECKVANV